ncbi:tyrosine-protein phosphatase [Microbacterium sp. M1A1_1b]
MSNHPTRARALFHAATITLAAVAVLGVIGCSATAAHADSALQPAMTTTDHPVTDVPGMVNGRALGSFTGLGGQTVDSSRLIRSESLDKLTTAGAQTLASKYHVDLVIDLRTPGQIAAKPDVPIPGAKDVAISMFGADGDYSDDTAMYHDLVDKGYVSATDRGPMITAYAQVLQILATHTSGTVLLHCSHGMDRTGTVIDLLDRVLGVDSADILHDYLLSNTQLGVTWATPALLQGTFESDVASKYAGMDSYLTKTIGVTSGEMTALRSRFLVSDDASASAISVAGVAVALDAAATAAGATVTAPIATLSGGDVHVTTTNAAATSAVSVQGDTAVVTVTAQDGTTTHQYRIALRRPVVTLSGSSSVPAGSSVTISSSGLTPGSVYGIVLHSDPVTVGHVTAAADGSVTATVTVPAGLAAGTHVLFLADPTGAAVTVPVSFTVTAPGATTSTTAATVTAAGRASTASGPAVATGGAVVTAPTSAPWLALGGLGLAILAGLGTLRLRTRLRTGR